jgi:hypothetical protein
MTEATERSVQPVTFYVGASADEPIELKVAHSGLRMVLVNRTALARLGVDWEVLGVYFLLGPEADHPDRFLAYVGEVGKRTLRKRLGEHLTQKAWWSRALLIASSDSEGFNSAEIGWLEGRLYDVLNNAVAATVKNLSRPGDDSIALKDRGVLERYVDPIIAALRAVGAPPDTADQQAVPAGRRRVRYSESVRDLIDADLLKPGTHLVSLKKKDLTTTATVLADGRLEIEGHEPFDAVSPAAQAASGNKAESGWEFWGAPSGDGGFVSLFALRDRLRGGQAGSAPTAPSTSPPPAPANAPAGTKLPGRKRHFGDTVKDLIDAGLLKPGAELLPVRKALDTPAIVLEDGTVEIKGSAPFASLSAAAQALSGNRSEPGWEFWTVAEGEKRTTLYELRSQLRSKREHGQLG